MKKNISYDFLDEKKIFEKIVDFHHKEITKVHFLIPSIHCSSCVLILEKLPTIHKGILNSNVDIINKTIWITINNVELKLSDLAKLLEKIGYPPSIDLGSFEFIQSKKKTIINNRKLLGKLAISFFCFGNIMILAIPEYLGAINDPWYINNHYFFRYIMLILALPIALLSITEYLKCAIEGIKRNIINIDLSIFIGITVLFLWSIYEIIYDIGPGYFDSLASFYLFILISKIFQIHTHKKIFSFNKNYKYFYPILITKIFQKKEKKVFLSSLKEGDVILIRNEEIIPVDSLLIKGKAILDSSFITGESYLINKKIGDKIYAGSKQKGSAIYLKVIKNVDHSYLSMLWKSSKKNRNQKKFYLESITNTFSKYFIPFVIFISIINGFYWFFQKNFYKIFQTIFSILIITCPCALILSSPLIFGNIIKFFSKKGFYIKDIFIMEKISSMNTLVFDKTGTLTDPNKEIINFNGKINFEEKKMIASLLNNSSHPLSQKILSKLNINKFYSVKKFKEILGKGLECTINNIPIKIGSPKYLGLSNLDNQTLVAISINNKFIGSFIFRNYYRKGIKKLFHQLKNYNIVILSGDNNEIERKYIKSILPKKSKILFNQNPNDKLIYIKKLQEKGMKIIMFGDGINDCAALNQSEIGIAVSDNPTSFFPSCDAFLQSNFLDKIYLYLKISRISSILVMINFTISLFYNSIGLIFAITGKLNPLISSILMPISSFSVIIFSIISTRIISKKFTF
ncbi:heavy metal translocating P-type ATPase [Blattabacterium cuenoti]|uniref:heavy metal translocating P-type ATPase n=1 Tax=Blattabacterium cuenoti TaxID=1653831 RepID=UPI00163CB995|nr:HAD-IC family P-type ATPase [Blattabacterium cuenoti]